MLSVKGSLQPGTTFEENLWKAKTYGYKKWTDSLHHISHVVAKITQRQAGMLDALGENPGETHPDYLEQVAFEKTLKKGDSVVVQYAFGASWHGTIVAVERGNFNVRLSAPVKAMQTMKVRRASWYGDSWAWRGQAWNWLRLPTRMEDALGNPRRSR